MAVIGAQSAKHSDAMCIDRRIIVSDPLVCALFQAAKIVENPTPALFGTSGISVVSHLAVEWLTCVSSTKIPSSIKVIFFPHCPPVFCQYPANLCFLPFPPPSNRLSFLIHTQTYQLVIVARHTRAPGLLKSYFSFRRRLHSLRTTQLLNPLTVHLPRHCLLLLLSLRGSL